MKKIITSAISLAAAVCVSAPLTASAADGDYVPELYFRANSSRSVAVLPNGNAVLLRSELGADESARVSVSVYVADESLSCWYVSPKWKCPGDYAALEGLIDPLPMSDSAPNIAYAYAETDTDGQLTSVRHSTLVSTDTEFDTMAFTCQVSSFSDRSAMKPYGERSDSYPLTGFDVSISADAPEGEIDVHFLTDHEDYPDQRISEVAMRTEAGSVVVIPRTKPLTITVTDARFGDINSDGRIDSNDASAVLIAYSKSSTGAEHGLSDVQFACGDTDGNGQITSSDASNMLGYYAYLSTSDGEKSFTDFLSR